MKDLLVRRLPVRCERVRVANVVKAVVESFALRVGDAGAKVQAQVSEGLRASLDPLRIRRALGNLLDNAMAHTPRGGGQ